MFKKRYYVCYFINKLQFPKWVSVIFHVYVLKILIYEFAKIDNYFYYSKTKIYVKLGILII